MSIHNITMKKIRNSDKYRFCGNILNPFKAGDIMVFRVSGKDIKTVISPVTSASPYDRRNCRECIWHTDDLSMCKAVNTADLVMCIYIAGRNIYKQMTDMMEEL